MIAIEGSISSGKSTMIRGLCKHLQCQAYLEPVRSWSTQLESFYKDPKRFGLSLQLKVLISFLRAGKNDSALVERSPLSSRYIFGRLLHDDGLLTGTEMDTYESVYDALDPLLIQPTACIYVYSEPSDCFRRAAKGGRLEEASLTEQYLRKLHTAHESILKRLPYPVCPGVFRCESPCFERAVWIDGRCTQEEVLKLGLRAVEYLTTVA